MCVSVGNTISELGPSADFAAGNLRDDLLCIIRLFEFGGIWAWRGESCVVISFGQWPVPQGPRLQVPIGWLSRATLSVFTGQRHGLCRINGVLIARLKWWDHRLRCWIMMLFFLPTWLQEAMKSRVNISHPWVCRMVVIGLNSQRAKVMIHVPFFTAATWVGSGSDFQTRC